MAFRLKRGRSISKELQRISRAEFRVALGNLNVENPSDEAIHEARKSLKKIRAVLRLLRQPLGPGYRTENRRLREVAHRLGPTRDADAMVETLQLIHGRYPTVVTDGIARNIERGLEPQRRKTKAHTSRLLATTLRDLRRSQRSLPNRIKRVARFGVVRTGLARGYRRVWQVMRGVSMDSDATQFHALRRRVKDHTYHMRLFKSLHPMPRSRARRLRRLESWLGDDHNLALLRSAILDAPENFGNARSTALVLGCIVKAQTSRRRKALKLGRRLFGRKPTRFSDAVTDWRNAPTR